MKPRLLNQMQPKSYITTLIQLKTEIDRRLDQRKKIRNAVNQFAFYQYGITDFLDLVDQFGPRKTSQPSGFLARQIPCVNIEGVSVAVLCRLLGLDFLIGPFADDTFSTSSLDKVPPLAPQVRISQMKRNRKCLVNIERREQYSAISSNKLNGLLIRDIGRLYPDYGSVVQSRTEELCRMADAHSWDPSSFWRECMKKASRKPDLVYMAEPHFAGPEWPRTVVKVPYSKDLEDRGEEVSLRPSAKWYYDLYFCLYMTGEIVLMDTYANPRGQVAEAERLFMKTVDTIRTHVGEIPMVVEIQPLSEGMLDINAEISPVAFADIQRLCAPRKSDLDIPSLHAHIADSVYSYSTIKKWHALLDLGLGNYATGAGIKT